MAILGDGPFQWTFVRFDATEVAICVGVLAAKVTFGTTLLRITKSFLGRSWRWWTGGQPAEQ